MRNSCGETNGITVRDALDADAPTITDFNLRMALETEGKALDPALLSRGVVAALRDPKLGRYFVGIADGCIVGQVLVTYEWSDWRNGLIWWLQSVYVEPAARRRGVFRALFRHVQDLAASEPGVVGLRLYVENRNEHAMATYERLGMEDAGYRVLEWMACRARG